MSHPKKKPLTHCQKYGHSWQVSTSDDYRTCIHAGCQAVQRRIAGIWTTKDHTTVHPVATDPLKQTPLWG